MLALPQAIHTSLIPGGDRNLPTCFFPGVEFLVVVLYVLVKDLNMGRVLDPLSTGIFAMWSEFSH